MDRRKAYLGTGNLLRLGIPEDYHSARFINSIGQSEYSDSFKLSKVQKENYAEIGVITKEYLKKIDSTRKGLFVWGHNGSGKSYYTCGLLIDMLLRDMTVFRTTMVGLVERFTSFGWKFPKICLSCDILLLEELGKEPIYKSRLSESIAETLLKYRDERKKITWLVTNCNLDELVERYGPSIKSIVEGRMIPLKFPDVDLRLLQ